MKITAILIIIAVLLTAILTLVVYQFIYSDKAEQRIITLIEEEIQIKNEEQMQELKQVAFNAENIATAYNGSSELKHVIQVYFADNGELPDSLAQLNMADDWTPSAKIKSVKLHKNGVFTVILNNDHTKGSLVFTPTIHQDSFWIGCVLHLILRALGGICRRVFKKN